MSGMYSRGWWGERLPLISAFVAGEKIIVATLKYGQQYIAFDEEVYRYTITPKTITVNGFEVPAPETVAPVCGTLYFYSLLDGLGRGYNMCTWHGNPIDYLRLNRGLVYLNDNGASSRTQAMLGIDPAEDCK
jgi:hypothetical protein